MILGQLQVFHGPCRQSAEKNVILHECKAGHTFVLALGHAERIEREQGQPEEHHDLVDRKAAGDDIGRMLLRQGLELIGLEHELDELVFGMCGHFLPSCRSRSAVACRNDVRSWPPR